MKKNVLLEMKIFMIFLFVIKLLIIKIKYIQFILIWKI